MEPWWKWVLFYVLIGTSTLVFSQETLYYNGRIYTSDSIHPSAGYFLVSNGMIRETGEKFPEARLSEITDKINLQGMTVMPGIVDSHIHFIDGSLGMLQISLAGVADSSGLKSSIDATSGQLIDGYYVARDLGFSALSGVISPREFLDRILPDTPVIIFLRSGHAAVANSAGLRKLGFTHRTVIEDGTIGKDGNGEPNGWLLEAAAMEGLKRVGEKYSGETIEKAIETGQRLALSYGITTLGDNTFNPYHMKIYQSLERQGDLKIKMWTRSFGRIPQTTSLMKPMGVKKLGFIGPENNFSRVHWHLIKLFEDMSLSVPPGVTGAVEPGGKVYLTKDEIKQYLILHPEDKFAFHVQGEKGLWNILNAMEELGPRNADRRHVIDHAGYSTETQIKAIRDLGSSVTILASQNFDYPSLARQYSQTQSDFKEVEMLDARLKYEVARGALTSDFPYGMDTSFVDYPDVDGMNPFRNMAVTVTGRLPGGQVIRGFEQNTLTAEEAALAYTTNGAYVLGEEEHLGKISQGYQADFIVLDQDVFSKDPMELYRCKVERTYSDGELVYARDTTLLPERGFRIRKISPYDYTLSPAIGYDPTVGFFAGGAAFLYPLQVPANYADLQVMATFRGKVYLQAAYIRYGIIRNADLKIPFTYSSLPQFYYGEGDTTDAGSFTEIYSDRYTFRPEFRYTIADHWKASVFSDFRSRVEKKSVDEEGNPAELQFPDESRLGLGISLEVDTRDNPGSTKLGFFGSVGFEQVAGLLSVTPSAGLLWGELRYFHYIYTSKFVVAGRLSAGTSFGTPGYLSRYTLGGADRLRGYYSNRFRGNQFYSAQAEFRFPIYRWFSGVCFLDVGDIGDGRLDQVLLSYGGGVRFSINDNVTLRLDYGRGKDQSGLFFTFGEAF